eukprot:365720-Chlamydomonas_euryale.AAC.20
MNTIPRSAKNRLGWFHDVHGWARRPVLQLCQTDFLASACHNHVLTAGGDYENDTSLDADVLGSASDAVPVNATPAAAPSGVPGAAPDAVPAAGADSPPDAAAEPANATNATNATVAEPETSAPPPPVDEPNATISVPPPIEPAVADQPLVASPEPGREPAVESPATAGAASGVTSSGAPNSGAPNAGVLCAMHMPTLAGALLAAVTLATLL